MPEIEKDRVYEIHRPKALVPNPIRNMNAAFMTGVQRRKFDRARQRANTGGPLMLGGEISKVTGEQVDELYTEGLLGGANPCCVEDNGHVLIGHFEFVPIKE